MLDCALYSIRCHHIVLSFHFLVVCKTSGSFHINEYGVVYSVLIYKLVMFHHSCNMQVMIYDLRSSNPIRIKDHM